MKTVVVQRRRSGKTDINWMAEGGGGKRDETYFSLQVVVFLSKYSRNIASSPTSDCLFIRSEVLQCLLRWPVRSSRP